MRITAFYSRCFFAGIFYCLLCCASCTKGLQKETIVYQNDFENGSLEGIESGKTEAYNGGSVLGRFAKDGFKLHVESLPRHDLIRLSFDLYIHDNWAGNAPNGSIDGSDVWIMNIEGQTSIYTTFSNKPCAGAICFYQSYPKTLPFANNKAGSNAIKNDLPGACSLKDLPGGTTSYRIVGIYDHTKSSFEFNCASQLPKGSAADICNKSWSVDNLTIKAIEYR